MKIIMSATPQHGHVLPLLPLARALRDAGNEVAVLTSGGMRSVIEPEGFRLLPAGPPPGVMLAEVKARTGADPGGNPTPEWVAEFFARVRVELTADEALAEAREFRPDLIVREALDYVGPLVAAARDVPMATLALGPARPSAFIAALDAAAESSYAAWGLPARPSTWHLDTCPPSLQADSWRRPGGWQLLRPEPHQPPGAIARAPEVSARPRVLVTFGTFFNAPQVVSPLVRQLSELDVDIVVSLGLHPDPRQFEVDHSRVTFVPFTPLASLLPGTDAVLAHGGAGTTLGTLSRGIPLVITPQGADQFNQAERVAAVGAGIALQPGEATPEAVTEAVRTVLSEPSYREAAAAVAKDIASMPEPSRVAALLEKGA
jgi:UDP:flavonoid glycosyltransferase YjiC (YdhE family)